MANHYIKTAIILTLPMLLSGCMTGYTVMQATQGSTVYRDDKIRRVEKAVQTQDGKLVALFEGRIAGASKSSRFTVSIPLTDSDFVTVPRSAVTDGWHLPEGTNLLSIAVVFPVVLPGHEDSFNERDKFLGLAEAPRTMYVVWNEKRDLNIQLVYVVHDAHPQKRFYLLASKDEERAHEYPLLLLLPLTVAGDIATLPFQGLFWLIAPRE
jgi:hypothetical protein